MRWLADLLRRPALASWPQARRALFAAMDELDTRATKRARTEAEPAEAQDGCAAAMDTAPASAATPTATTSAADLAAPVPMEQRGPGLQKYKNTALLLGFVGTNFHGMQSNPDVKTIQDELLDAMLRCGIIMEQHRENPAKGHYHAVSRTDKGVHAARMVVNMKVAQVEGVIEKLNAELPPDIRAFGHQRTTKRFNCQQSASWRQYEYLLPTYCLAAGDQQTPAYRSPKAQLEQLTDVLQSFVGTHQFHSFTSKRAFGDPSCQRYIMSFTCREPLVIDGLEVVPIVVRGQSFILNQIRKMIGMAIAVLVGTCDLQMLKRALVEDGINTPRAPGGPLMLDIVSFDHFNTRVRNNSTDVDPIDFERCEAQVLDFKVNHIYRNIVAEELKDTTMKQWTSRLGDHLFDKKALEAILAERSRERDRLAALKAADTATEGAAAAATTTEAEAVGDPAVAQS